MKGGYHVWSDTGFIRYGAVVCRIVNWMGLTAYNVTSPLDIWTTFGAWLSRRLCGPPSKEENCLVSIIYFIEWTAMGGGCVGQIWSNFGLQLPWPTSSPPVKGDYHVWSDTGLIRPE